MTLELASAKPKASSRQRLKSKAFGPLRGHELMDGIDFDQDEMAEAPLDSEIDITNLLSEKLAITKELAVHSLLTNTANITNNTTLSGSKPMDELRQLEPAG